MTTSSTSVLKITRSQLDKFCPDNETVRQFEKLFLLVKELDPASGGGSVDPIGDTFETVNQNIQAYNKTLTYPTDNLEIVTYNLGSSTITKTLGYSGDFLTTIILSGDTPGGVSLTKTLFYTGDDLSAVTYS